MPLTEHEYKQLRSAFQAMHEPTSGHILKQNAIIMIGRWLESHIRVTEEGNGDYMLSFDGEEEEEV